MTPARTSLLIASLIAVALPCSAAAQSRVERMEVAQPLLELLALVPDAPEARMGSSGVGYVDLRALEGAHGVPQEPDRASTSPWRHAMLRWQVGLHDARTRALILVAGMTETVGVDWLTVDHGLSYGDPPYGVTILAAEACAAAVAERLTARDFEVSEVDGVTVWHRFEDNRVNLRARDAADPFGGHLGQAARIALLPGHLASSSRWQDVEAVIATAHGRRRSLAEAADYRTLAEAVTDPAHYSGDLVQALFINPFVTGLTLDTNGAHPAAPSPAEPTGGVLPLFELAVLADRQEGSDQLHLMALLYRDRTTAEVGAREMARRIGAFDPSGVFEEARVTVDEPRIHVSDTGYVVAIASLRYPLPEDAPGGVVFRDWHLSLLRRESPLQHTP